LLWQILKEMPVAFGFSVGDFIAALNLVNTVIEAVNNSRGSSATYRALIRELYVLESALLRVKNLEFEESQESEKRALEQAASQCQHAIDGFLTKIQAYQPHLRAEGSGDCSLARAKDAWMKIKWAFCKEEDVEKFKADLRGHSASIQLLLQTIEMYVIPLTKSVYNSTKQQQEKFLDPGREGRSATPNACWTNSRCVGCTYG
jgi:Fungal N-terminal domain of STAND proteins